MTSRDLFSRFHNDARRHATADAMSTSNASDTSDPMIVREFIDKIAMLAEALGEAKFFLAAEKARNDALECRERKEGPTSPSTPSPSFHAAGDADESTVVHTPATASSPSEGATPSDSPSSNDSPSSSDPSFSFRESENTPISPTLVEGASPDGTFHFEDTPEKTPESPTLPRGHYYSTHCLEKIEEKKLEELKSLLQNHFPLPQETCFWAAKHGHLEVLKFARGVGCPWNADTCTAAAMNGHLEVLQWARENGCPWDEKTCTAAAWQGRLKVLRWARANECPWDEDTCLTWAKAGGHLEVQKWVIENGCEC